MLKNILPLKFLGIAKYKFLWTGFILAMLCISILAGYSPAEAGGKKHRIKFATLAPEGTSWMKQMRSFSKEVSKQSNNTVSFKFYPGGVSGDERDVIRKMRIGQIHAAGFTGVGLGEILPEVRVLDLPFLFESDAQILHVYEKMNDYFAGKFEEKGYVLLGWVPVGWVYFFSKNNIQTVADLKKSRPWMWEGDPLVEKTYSALGVRPVPLSITDVLLSLQTGMIDTVYASSQGALALQWFTKIKTMSQIRMGYATGGVLITKKKFNKLSAEQQKTLKSLGKHHLNQLGEKIRQENESSVKVMTDNGVLLAPKPSSTQAEEFRRAGANAREKLAGTLFPKKLLDQVLGYMKEVK
jgi:TRAP-type C4-dicarboxylate transport system substrate-binding protein